VPKLGSSAKEERRPIWPRRPYCPQRQHHFAGPIGKSGLLVAHRTGQSSERRTPQGDCCATAMRKMRCFSTQVDLGLRSTLQRFRVAENQPGAARCQGPACPIFDTGKWASVRGGDHSGKACNRMDRTEVRRFTKCDLPTGVHLVAWVWAASAARDACSLDYSSPTRYFAAHLS